LDQLPEDAEPIAALLRIARQAAVPERALLESELAEGRWQIVRTGQAAKVIEPTWLRRRLPPASPFRPAAWLARLALRRFGAPVAGRRRAGIALAAVSLALIAGILIAGWFGFFALAFAGLAAAALANEAVDGLTLLQRSIFAGDTKPSRPLFILWSIWDLTLVAAGTLAIDATRAERLFPPLVIAGLLRLRPSWPKAGWRALPADRGVLAIVLALAAGFGLAEGAFMVLALLLILLRLAPAAEQRG
jgi:hypothetical protein